MFFYTYEYLLLIAWVEAQLSWVISLNEWLLQKCHHSSCFNMPSVLDSHLFLLPERWGSCKAFYDEPEGWQVSQGMKCKGEGGLSVSLRNIHSHTACEDRENTVYWSRKPHLDCWSLVPLEQARGAREEDTSNVNWSNHFPTWSPWVRRIFTQLLPNFQGSMV